NQLERDEDVVPMHVLRDRLDLALDEFAELALHRLHRLVEAERAEALGARVLRQGDEGIAARVLRRDGDDRGREQRLGDVVLTDAELRERDVLAGTQIHAAAQGPAELADVSARNPRLELAAHALGPGDDLTRGLELGFQ